jgi:cobalt-zinc-cadmium efflux system membrane fusion protein
MLGNLAAFADVVIRMKRVPAAIPFCFAAALALALPAACKQNAEPAEEPPAPKREDGIDLVLGQKSLEAARLSTAKPKKVPRRSRLVVTGSVDFAPSRVARIGPQIAGRVASIRVAPGQTVAKGAVVATMDSVDVGRAQADFLEAKSRLALAETEAAREQRMLDVGATSERATVTSKTELELAKVSVKAASQRLQTLGAGSGGGNSSLGLATPIGGRVLELSARLGQPVGPTDTLVVVGETTEVWLKVDIYERDLANVKVGDDVSATAISYPERIFNGHVDELGTVVDAERRVLTARIVLRNPDDALRPGMTATARIMSTAPAAAPEVWSVPRAAVQAIDGQPFVFVDHQGGKFELRPIETGVELDEGLEIKRGIAGDETIVTDGSFILKSEVLRSQMGAND